MPKRLLHLFGALAAVWASSPRSHPRRPARHIQPPRRAGTRAAAAKTHSDPWSQWGNALAGTPPENRHLSAVPAARLSCKPRPMKCPMRERHREHLTRPRSARERAPRLPAPACPRWTTNNCAAATSSDACFALPKEASGRHRLVLSRLVRICAARSCQAFDLVVVGLRRVGRGAGRVRVGGHGWCGARGRPAVSRSTTVPCGRPAT
jgi:hypothetical protein